MDIYWLLVMCYVLFCAGYKSMSETRESLPRLFLLSYFGQASSRTNSVYLLLPALAWNNLFASNWNPIQTSLSKIENLLPDISKIMASGVARSRTSMLFLRSLLFLPLSSHLFPASFSEGHSSLGGKMVAVNPKPTVSLQCLSPREKHLF